MATVISYLRFSTLEQAKGDSTRRQTDKAEEWCKANGQVLLEKNRLKDMGLSGYHGVNVREGALAGFLQAIKDKKIAKGTILLVEELDRLSRQSVEKSIPMFLNIVSQGITIITLNTGDVFTAGKIDVSKLMIAVVKFATANDESAKKADRLKSSWSNKRKNMAVKPMTSLIPAWLKIQDKKIVEDKPKADIVRKIFQLVLDGNGRGAICKQLNQTVAPIARGKYWRQSYIAKILNNRAVIGECQAYTSERNEEEKEIRVKNGEAVKGYFPAIVSDQTFYAVQSILKSRKHHNGPATKYINLFSGLITNSDDGSNMICVNKTGSRQLLSSAVNEGRKGASKYILFPIDTFEAGFCFRLAILKDVNLDFGDTKQLDKEVLAIDGKLLTNAEEIAKLKKSLRTMPDISTIVEVLKEIEAENKKLGQRKEELLATIASNKQQSACDALMEMIKIIVMNRGKTINLEERKRLRMMLRTVVDSIKVSVSKAGHIRSLTYTARLVSGYSWTQTMQIHVRKPLHIMTIDENGKLDPMELGNWQDMQGNAVAVSPIQIAKIKEMWGNGFSGTKIARELKLSVSTCYRHKPDNWKPNLEARYAGLKLAQEARRKQRSKQRSN